MNSPFKIGDKVVVISQIHPIAEQNQFRSWSNLPIGTVCEVDRVDLFTDIGDIGIKVMDNSNTGYGIHGSMVRKLFNQLSDRIKALREA